MSIIPNAVLNYLKNGFSLIPVNPTNKKPFIKWEECQKRQPTTEEIKSWWIKWPNAMIGIVTGKVSGLCVIDIDTVEGHEAVQKYIPDGVMIPTAETPNGGQHLYFKCPDPAPGNNTKRILGCDFRGEGGYVIAPPSVNGTGKAYVWLSGLSLLEVEPPPLPPAYLHYINNNKYAFTNKENVTGSVTLFTQGRRDNDLFHTANCLIKGGMRENEATQVLEFLAKCCDPPFPLDEIKTKVESALKRSERRNFNLAEEVRAYVSVTNGYFSVTECFKTLQSVTGVTKRDNIRQILHRLEKEHFIEKYGEQDGVYRRVENECEEIDFLHALDQSLDIRFPFEIERYVKILPKNIVVVAGEPNAGKTAFLLNVVRINMQKHKVHYFSSEMGALELRDRLSKFEFPLDQWKFSAKERSSNFGDVIQPDDINIVDFLEMTDEFYKVGAYIKDIFDKLKNGIAVIAIQKNRGTDYGLGGMRSLEKARLYLSMGPGKIKIIKAKNWASQTNPNGLELDFKLIQGCKFQIQADWNKPNGKKN